MVSKIKVKLELETSTKIREVKTLEDFLNLLDKYYDRWELSIWGEEYKKYNEIEEDIVLRKIKETGGEYNVTEGGGID